MARLRHLVFGAVALLSVGSELYGQVSPAAAARGEVQQAVRAYVDAMSKGDFSSLAEMYSRQAGVTSVGSGKITRGWDQIREDIDGHLSLAGRFSVSVGSIDVTMLGPSNALTVTKIIITVPAAGDQVQRTGAMTLLFQKSEGEWKIIHDHTSIEDAGAAGSNTGTSSPAPEPRETAHQVNAVAQPSVTTIPIADGRAVEIKPTNYLNYTFQLPAGTCVIGGRVTGVSGGNKDFEVLIMTDDNFQNWAAGQKAWTVWQSGRVVVTTIGNPVITTPGTYHLVLSNVWSQVTTKTVQPQVAAGCSN